MTVTNVGRGPALEIRSFVLNGRSLEYERVGPISSHTFRFLAEGTTPSGFHAHVWFEYADMSGRTFTSEINLIARRWTAETVAILPRAFHHAPSFSASLS